MDYIIEPESLLCIDLFCGLGGWSEGFLAEGYMCFGFDLEPQPDYPGEFVQQDIRTIHGRQFKDATVIVASPPCQFFSYTAMPWTRAKKLAREVESDPLRLEKELELFKACFRIQREASEAAGRKIPLMVENVRGAQKWVGRAKCHYGSYYLWGDLPALMPITGKFKSSGMNWSNRDLHVQDFTRIAARQNGYGKSNCETHERLIGPGRVRFITEGRKIPGNNGPYLWRDRGFKRLEDAIKMHAEGQYLKPESGRDWFDMGLAMYASGSSARKQASALIAMIPFPLAQWIARVHKEIPF